MLRLLVEIPKNLNTKQKELIKELQKVTTDKNYQKRKSFMDKIKDLFKD